MTTQPTESDSPSTGRFPGDLGALVSFPFVALASSVLFTWLFTSRAAIIWAAALPGFVGLLMLTWARLPLYRQRQFFSFGPGGLNARHRRIYWRAHVLIAVSLLALAVYVATH